MIVPVISKLPINDCIGDCKLYHAMQTEGTVILTLRFLIWTYYKENHVCKQIDMKPLMMCGRCQLCQSNWQVGDTCTDMVPAWIQEFWGWLELKGTHCMKARHPQEGATAGVLSQQPAAEVTSKCPWGSDTHWHLWQGAPKNCSVSCCLLPGAGMTRPP